MDIIAEPSSVDQIYYPEAFIKHPFYHKKEENPPAYDILMIVVDRPIKFSQYASPICLPNHNDHELFFNQEVKAAGKYFALDMIQFFSQFIL